MSDVRSAVRVLRIFEAYAAHGAPMTLSELAAKLDMPPSSCLLLIRTLLARGYLYAPGRRSAYYPTKRLAEIAKEIERNDPIIDRFQPHLDYLRDATHETVTLAKRQGDRLIYLATAESREVVRASVRLGLLRPLHATATGRALLATMEDSELQALLSGMALDRLTTRTPVTLEDVHRLLGEVRLRGYADNMGESFADLSAVSVALRLGGDTYAVTIMGPSHRVDPKIAEHGQRLVEYIRKVSDDAQGRSRPPVDVPVSDG